MDISETPSQARQRLLSSIRRVPPAKFPLYYEVFHHAHRVHWNLIDERNTQRLTLTDVLGIGQDRAGLSWDDIAACREQQAVATWLDGEIDRETKAILKNNQITDPDQLIEEISRALMLDSIETPRTIFHVAALHNNVPLYELFVRHGFFGQGSKYASDLVDHAQSGLLPWELARTIGSDIGIYAAAQYLKLIETHNTLS